MLPLSSVEAQQALYIHMGEEPMADDFPESLKEVVDDWCFETEPNHPSNGPGPWLHSSDGGIDAVCAFIQHLLQKYDPQGHGARMEQRLLQAAHRCLRRRHRAHHGACAGGAG